MTTIQVGKLNIAVTDVGEGPPVVLLHGLACGRRMWFHQIGALRSRFRVIAYDLRGHGETDAPAEPSAYSATHLARDLVGVLDALHVERAAIVGFSLGGAPALALAATKPERVSHLILADVGAGADDPVKIETLARQWVALIDRGRIDDLVGEMLRCEFYKVYAGRNVRCRDHMAALIRATPIDGLRFTLSEVLMRRKSLFRLTSLLKSVRVPTLVMAGQYDYVCSKGTRVLAQAIPDASLKFIEDSGHMAPLEQPAAFSVALLEFLAKPTMSATKMRGSGNGRT